MCRRSGFTLIELIIVISLIGILSTLGFVSFSSIQANSRATKMASDFQQIKLAFRGWKSATDGRYPRDNTQQNPDYRCVTREASISQVTEIQKYLEQEYRDPWKILYTYDNDGDTYVSGSPAYYRGVNVIARWCPGDGDKYLDVAPLIDQSLDGDKNSRTGSVRWDTNPAQAGAIYFLISPDEDQ